MPHVTLSWMDYYLNLMSHLQTLKQPHLNTTSMSSAYSTLNKVKESS